VKFDVEREEVSVQGGASESADPALRGPRTAFNVPRSAVTMRP
jgi:hypothetical protein